MALDLYLVHLYLYNYRKEEAYGGKNLQNH